MSKHLTDPDAETGTAMRSSRPVLVLLAAALALGLVATTDDTGEPFVALDASAVVDATSIVVDGTLAFGGVQEAALDGAGDAVIPGIGTDFTRATLEQDGETLLATIEIDDGVPELHGTPELVQYGWDVTAGSASYSLSAWRSATWQSGTPGAEVFSVQTCAPDPDTGQSTCVSDPVEGEFTETHLRWIIPFEKLTAEAGIQLAPAGPIHATPGAAGRVWFNPGAASLDEMQPFTLFTLGGLVEAALVDDGGEVVVAQQVTVGADGAFGATFSDVAAGDYTVVVSSTYADVDATVAIPVTVEDPNV